MPRGFLLGAAVGVAGVWAFHKYVRPMSSNKN